MFSGDQKVTHALFGGRVPAPNEPERKAKILKEHGDWGDQVITGLVYNHNQKPYEVDNHPP